MNIEEILNQLEYFNEEDYKYYSDFKLNRNQIKQLLDYITNLQKKVSGLETENKKLWERHNEEYSQISKAIQYVNTHKPSDTISFPLMKKYEENQVKSCFDYEFRKIYQKELLNILQGSDKEWT